MDGDEARKNGGGLAGGARGERNKWRKQFRRSAFIYFDIPRNGARSDCRTRIEDIDENRVVKVSGRGKMRMKMTEGEQVDGGKQD